MLNASPAAQNLVASYNGGKVSAQGMATAQNMAKTSTIGLTIAQTALNVAIGMGIGLLINLVVQGVNKLIHANEEAIESAKKLREEYEEFKSTNASNVSTLKGLEEEFKELSKGVSQYGDNISLTTEQYERYKEIIQQIVGMSPSLAEGYDTENGYIADKNGLLERAIELQEIEYRNELRKITNLENLKTSMAGYIAEYKDAFEGGFVTEDMSATSTIKATDFSNALYQAFNVNDRADYDSEDLAREILKSLGIDDVDREMEKFFNKNGYYQPNWFYDEYVDEIANNINAITDALSFETVELDEDEFENRILTVKDCAQAYLDMKDSISMANESIQTDLRYIAEYADGYDSLSSEQQKFVNEFLKGFNIDDITSRDWFGNPTYDEDKMKSVKRQINDFVEALSQDEETKDALADLYAIPTDEQSINEFVEQFRSALEIIKAYCEENGIEIPIAITDSEKVINELEAQQQRAVDFAKDKFNGYDPTAFFKENSINTEEEVDKWLEIAQAANSAADAEERYVQSSTLNNESGISFNLEEFSNGISEITSAYSTLSSAIEEYNTNGAYSLDTMSKLLSLKPEYLALLVDENGQLSLNEQGLRSIIGVQLEQAQAEIYATGISKLNALAQKEVGEASTTASTEMENSIESINAQTEAYNANTLAKAGNLAVSDGASQSDVDAIIAETKAQVKAIQNAVQGLSFNVGGVAGGFDSSSTKDATQKSKEYIESYMDFQKKSLEKGMIDYNTYCNTVSNLLKRMYKEGKIAGKDYYDYQKQMLESQKDVMDRVLSAVTNRIDEEISAIEKQKDAIQSTIDKLREENDEHERAVNLEKAKYNLAKLQTQRTKKLYAGEGRGFIYTTDDQAIREAQKEVQDLQFEEVIAGLEKEKDALDKDIQKLEDYKDQWESVTDKYQKEQDELLAAQILGQNWEFDILSGRLSTLNNFAEEYYRIQQSIVDAAWQSANEQNKAMASIGTGSTNGGGEIKTIDYSQAGNAFTKKTSTIQSNSSLRNKQDKIYHNKMDKLLLGYSTGTDNAKKGIREVSENGDEIIIDNNNNAILAKGRQLYNFEGGERVIERDKSKELLGNHGNLIPIELENMSENFRKLYEYSQAHPIIPNFAPSINLQKLDSSMINRNNQTNVTIGDIHLHEVQNVKDFGAELNKYLPGVSMQFRGKL